MASDYDIKSKQLKDELAKPYPDSDIVYALQQTKNYWNTVDNDKVQRGFDKLRVQK